MPIALAPFDAARDFVAQTSFRADGTIWLRKQPFDKYRVNLRVLRQLYESRKIAYGDGSAADVDPQTAPPGDETPEDKHEDQIAPTGAEGADDGQGGQALDSDLDENGDGAQETNETTGAAAADSAPTEAEEADAASGGSATAASASADREAVIKRLIKRHNHDALFARASGLAGVTKEHTKAEIAGALVDAGRVGDGTA